MRIFRLLVAMIAIAFAVFPIIWVISAALNPTGSLATQRLIPENASLRNLDELLNDPIHPFARWLWNSIKISSITAILSVFVIALSAYAFSRFKFIGDGQMFFWLLTNRMAPPAVFLLPYLQLYSTINLMDTHIAVALAHCLFNVPLAIWILEGFMSGIPKEIDETAFIDGYSFPRFFITIFIPLIRGGVGVTAFFCFMFSWVELLFARTLTITEAKPITATMTRTISASGLDWGLLAAAGVLTIVPGALVIWFVRNYMAKGFALGRV